MAVYAGDRAAFVRDAVLSILRQSHSELDLFIYVDGPVPAEVDATLDELARADSRIRIRRHPVNRGLAFCLNELIAETRDTFQFFARMDADDVSLPHRFRAQIAFLEAHPGVDVVGGHIVDMTAAGTPTKTVRYPLVHDDMLRFFRRRNPIGHVTAMFRRSYFDRAGLYPETRLEDGLYWMQGFMRGCVFANVDEPLVMVRQTDDFLRRRGGWRGSWAEFRIKRRINRALRLGFSAHCYAFAMLIVQLLPVPIKRGLYQALR